MGGLLPKPNPLGLACSPAPPPIGLKFPLGGPFMPGNDRTPSAQPGWLETDPFVPSRQ
jgi:hypothetical protein